MRKVQSPSAKRLLVHHPPAEARYQASPPDIEQACLGRWSPTWYDGGFNESGFGGWADEKIKNRRVAAPLLLPSKNEAAVTESPSVSPKTSSTTFDNIS